MKATLVQVGSRKSEVGSRKSEVESRKSEVGSRKSLLGFRRCSILMLTIPESVIKTNQAALFSFLWKNRKDKIKRLVMCQPLAEGGVNFVNFNRMVKSLRLAWIGRLLDESDDKWKSIPNYYFQNHGGLPFLLKCNYNVAVLNKGLPLCYRELLQYFEDFKNITNVFPDGEFILWNNKSITIADETLFWKTWFERGR